jgi:hypothetical protein
LRWARDASHQGGCVRRLPGQEPMMGGSHVIQPHKTLYVLIEIRSLRIPCPENLQFRIALQELRVLPVDPVVVELHLERHGIVGQDSDGYVSFRRALQLLCRLVNPKQQVIQWGIKTKFPEFPRISSLLRWPLTPFSGRAAARSSRSRPAPRAPARVAASRHPPSCCRATIRTARGSSTPVCG